MLTAICISFGLGLGAGLYGGFKLWRETYVRGIR